MLDTGREYRVIVPAELVGQWEDLSTEDHLTLSGRLKRAAQSAYEHPSRWPEGVAGIHRGRHRAVAGGLWLLYQRDDERRTVSLIGFGRVVRERSEVAE